MIQKKSLKDAIQNPEIISVVGGLIGIANKDKGGLMSPFLYNSLFTFSGYQSGYFKIHLDSDTVQEWAFRITLLGVCEYEIYRLNENIKAYFLSKQNTEISPGLWYDSDNKDIYVSASQAPITMSTLYSNSTLKNLVVSCSTINKVPESAAKISIT